MKSNVEIELKLLIGDKYLEKLLQLPMVVTALVPHSCKTRRLITSYFDTVDMVLKRNGIAYRVRDKGDGSFEATVKTAKKNTGGVTERVELNIPLKENLAVLDGFKELGLGIDLRELAPQGVEKLFTVDVERTTYLLAVENALIELAIDKGQVIAGELTDKIDEIELELKEGEAPALLQFAAQLATKVPLFVEAKTKYARGLALRNIKLSAPVVLEEKSTIRDREDLLGRVQHCGNTIFELQNLHKNGLAGETASLVTNLERLEKLLQESGTLGITLTEELWEKLKRLLAVSKEAQTSVAPLQQELQQGAFTALVYKALSEIANA